MRAWLSACVLWSSSILATESPIKTPLVALSAQQSLINMIQAREDLSYQISYVLIRPQGIESLRYQQWNANNGHRLARLMTLNGAMREVIQRGETISYFEPNLTPFTLEAEHIEGALPPLQYLEASHFQSQYDVISMGRAREAGAICDVIRVTPKQADRYGYVLWLDRENHLLLRADLLDQQGKVIEQYLALSFEIGEDLEQVLSPLNEIILPEVLSPTSDSMTLPWSLEYVPEGFSPLVVSRHRPMNLDQTVETKMYSDGVFSFSVYLMSVGQSTVPQQWGKQGRRTIVTTQKGQQEVVVIGDIPVSTAKRIAESVRLTQIDDPSS